MKNKIIYTAIGLLFGLFVGFEGHKIYTEKMELHTDNFFIGHK